MLLFTLAWRNLWRNKRRTWITVFSVVFAVALSVFLESMDRGSQESLVENVVQFSTGYIQIQDTLYQDEMSIDNSFYFDEELMDELLNTQPNIDFLAPRIETFALAAGNEKSRVAMVYGIEIEAEHRLNQLKDRLQDGSFFQGIPLEAVIAEGLAQNIGLGVGDTLVLLGQGFHGITAAGKFTVVGIMKHPVADVNEMMVYLPISEAQEFLGAYDQVTSILVTPQNRNRHQRLALELSAQPILSEFNVLTWEQLQPELYNTIKFDQVGTLIFLLILYVVIGFGIFGTVLTMTLEREKEFGMLISVGMHRWKLAFVIFIETLIINFLGVIFGILLSIPFVLYFFFNPIPVGENLSEVMSEYGMDAALRFSLDPQLFYQQGIIVFIISMIIVLYPIFRILSLNVLDASKK